MTYDPKLDSWCSVCGNDPEECICMLSPDIPPTMELLDEFDPDFYYEDWGKEEPNESPRN